MIHDLIHHIEESWKLSCNLNRNIFYNKRLEDQMKRKIIKILMILSAMLLVVGLSACGTDTGAISGDSIREFNGLQLPEHENWSYTLDEHGLLQVVSNQSDFNDTNININAISGEGFESITPEFRLMGMEASISVQENLHQFQAFDVPNLGVPARALSYFMTQGNVSYDCLNFIVDYNNTLFLFTYMQPINDDYSVEVRDAFVAWVQSFDFN